MTAVRRKVSEIRPLSTGELTDMRKYINSTCMRRIIFRSTTDRIYDAGPITLQYNIIILTIVLQLPTVFSTVICGTGL